jgi:hypothetical protein
MEQHGGSIPFTILGGVHHKEHKQKTIRRRKHKQKKKRRSRQTRRKEKPCYLRDIQKELL